MAEEKKQPPNPHSFNGQDEFLRRLHPDWWNWDEDRLTTSAFYNHRETPDRLSVNWSELSSVEHTVESHHGYGVASLKGYVFYTAPIPQDIEYTPNDNNEAHCDVIGDKKRKSVRRYMRDRAEVLLKPTRIDP